MTDGPAQAGQHDVQDPDGSDGSAALRFRHGEASAFAAVVAAHQQALARLVHRLLGWSGDVEDVVQEVFLLAWRKRRQLRQPERLSVWLARIAVNRCRSYQRRRFLRLLLAGDRTERAEAPAADGPQRAMAAEARARVRRAVRQLPVRLREVIVLRYLQDMPLPEMCRVLRIRPGAARVRLHRARAMLRDRLADLA